MSKLIARTVSRLHNEEDVVEVKSLEGDISSPSLELDLKYLNAREIGTNLENIIKALSAIEVELVGQTTISENVVQVEIGRPNAQSGLYVLTFGNTYTLLFIKGNQLATPYYTSGTFVNEYGVVRLGIIKFSIIQNFISNKFFIRIESDEPNNKFINDYTAHLFRVRLY